MYYLTLVLMFTVSLQAFGHGAEVHKKPKNSHSVLQQKNDVELTQEKSSNKILDKINQNYLSNVKGIFSGKCLSCHGINDSLPWYYNIPGPRQLMDQDMKEAKKHMDMSNDFPFGGHGSPKDDLTALSKTIDNGDMPPLKYRLLHWGSSLTVKEIKVIGYWIEDSQRLLKHK
jgi:hypothetical protein